MPLGQGVANLNASWMHTVAMSEDGWLGVGKRGKCGTEGDRGDLASLIERRPP